LVTKTIPNVLGRSVLAVALSTTTGTAFALTTNFSAAGSFSRWSDAANWDNGVANAVGTQAIISSGASAWIQGETFTVGTLTHSGDGGVSGVGTLIFDNGGSDATLTNQLASSSNQMMPNVVLNSALVVNQVAGGMYDFEGSISGSHGITLNGAGGWFRLAGTNTYTGGTTLNGGGLQIFDSSALGTGPLTAADGTTLFLSSFGNALTVNGTVNLEENITSTLSGVISGSGGVTKIGSGIVILSGANTYSGGTTISAGTLQIGNGGTSGAIQGDITNNSTLIFNRSNVLTCWGNISGTGTLIKQGDGALVLAGANTYSGGTTISAGTLQVGNGFTVGAIAGDITNNSALIFNRTDALTYAGAISGTGSLTKEGSGTLTLTGANAYSGGTTVSAGTLQIGDGGTAGSLTGNVTNNAALVFNRSDALTHSGVISGTGSLTQNGTDTLPLSGANTYTGTTTVNAGTLAVNGSITSATTVNSGAILGGSGSVAGTVTVAAGATLAPGNSPGTLTVNELLLDDTSALNFELGDPTGVAGTDSDLIVVNGNLTLDGVLDVTALAGFGAGTYRLIDYTGVLTDNTLTLGTLPADHVATVDTSTAGQVNLVVRATYTVTSTAGTGGSASCTADPIPSGDTATCTVTANGGYTRSSSVRGDCPAGSWSGSTWTTGAIVADCSVSFSFNAIPAPEPEPVTYLISATAGTGGSASCSPTTVEEGDTTTCTVIAEAGYTPSSTVTGSCSSGIWSGSSWTSGPITTYCTIDFTFVADEPEPYSDGTVSCEVGECTATDNPDGSRTISGSFTDPQGGGQVTFTVTTHPNDPNGGLDITLTTADGTTTRVTSAVPGSSVEVGTDENGRPKVTTHAELPDGTTLEVVVDADGYLTHRVTHLDGTVTETVVSLGGAEVAIDAVGRLTTSYQVEHGEALWRMVVETNADGTAVARYERFDAVTGEWVTERQLTDPISPLEAGHRVWMENVPGIGLRLRARIPVSSSLYF
jgi:autotransporter-associated beta strand protein